MNANNRNNNRNYDSGGPGAVLGVPDAGASKRAPQPILSPEFSYEDVICELSSGLETTKSALYNLARVLLNESMKSVIERTSKFKFPFCQTEWTEKTYFFRCKECSVTETSCVCIKCFQRSNHIESNHHFSIEESGMGGCCDCGNADSFLPQGFCCDHFLPEKAEHPASLLESGEFKLKLYCLARIMVNQLLNLLMYYRLQSSSGPGRFPIGQIMATKKSFGEIIKWLDEIARSSYPLMYIISEEFSNRLLNPTNFKLYDNTTPLPYQDIVPVSSALVPESSPIRVLLGAIVDQPEILNECRPIIFTLLGNRLFKTFFCEEFLKVYPKLAVSPDTQLKALVSTISCQMFELPSISIPFSTGMSNQNLVSVLTRVNHELVRKKGRYNLNNHLQRSDYDKVFSSNQDFTYIAHAFEHDAISRYVADGHLNIVEALLNLADDIQMMCPVYRLLRAPLEYELPLIPTLISIECQAITSFDNLIQSLNKQSIPAEPIFELIWKHWESKMDPELYYKINHSDVIYIQSDIFNAKVPVPTHLILNRFLGVYILGYVWKKGHTQFEALCQGLGKESLARLVTLNTLPMAMMGQHFEKNWAKNMNIQDYLSYYTWSFMWNDLITIQFSSILLGPKQFIYLSLSNFTGGFCNQYSEALSDFLKFVIVVLQYRVSPKYSQVEARYHIVQALASGISTFGKLTEYRKEFFYLNVEETIRKVSDEKDKTHKLKLEYWPEFDIYYPMLFFDKNSVINNSLNNYYEYLKGQHHPISESYPLPCKLEPLPEKMLPLLDIINSNDEMIRIVYQIINQFLLSDMGKNDLDQISATLSPVNTFIQSFLNQFKSSPNLYDNLLNHCLYLINQSLRLYTSTIYPQLSEPDQLQLKSSINNILNNNDNTNDTSGSNLIVNLLRDLDPLVKGSNLLNRIITLSKLIDTHNIFIEKKNLINDFFLQLYQINSNFENLFDIKDFLSQRHQIEAKLKKEKAMAYQKSIQEKMLQQQKKFLLQDDLMDNEDESDNDDNMKGSVSGVEKTCVICKKSGIIMDQNPLLAIGYVENSTVKKFSNQKSLKGVDANNTIRNLFDRYCPFENDSQLTEGIYMAMTCGHNTKIHMCGHYLHHQCLTSFVHNKLTTFKCPLCSRISNIVMLTDNFKESVSYNPAISKSLFVSLFSNDRTLDIGQTKKNASTSFYLWKFIVSNIEILEITSRSIPYYKDSPSDPNYHIFTPREFLRELDTLYLIYSNIMLVTLEYSHTFTLPTTDLNGFDPFVVASVEFFVKRTESPHTPFLDQYFALLKKIITHNFSDQDLSGNISDLIPKIQSIAIPYLRKYYLFLHYCYQGRPMESLESNPALLKLLSQTQIYSFLERECEFPSLDAILNSSEFKLLPTPIITAMNIPTLIESKLPKFTHLNENHIYFLLDHISRACPKSCGSLPKGVCLFCGSIVCYGSCCDEEELDHVDDCAYNIGLFMGVCKPDLNVIIQTSLSHKTYPIYPYHDKNDEIATKSKPFLKLKNSVMRNLYIQYLKSLPYNKTA